MLRAKGVILVQSIDLIAFNIIAMTAKHHNLRAFANINISHLLANLANIRALHANKSMIIMLKANAYGHGAVEIAKALDGLCDYFGVASVEEGIELILAGIEKTKVIVFSGFFSKDMVQTLIDYRLIPIIHSAYQYELLDEYFQSKYAEIWLKVNTGMNRLGLSEGEFEALYHKAQSYQKPINALTHLAESESCDQSFTLKQLQRFQALVKDKSFTHISAFNSAASLLNDDNFNTNTIRIGLALYGACAAAHPLLRCTLKPVMTLHSHVVAIQSIDVGDSVGYNRQYIAKVKTQIAIVTIGYGDGYPQAAPNGTMVAINGKLYPTAGKVSMDLMAIDIGMNKDIHIGDNVTLFGTHDLLVDDVAKHIGTSSYAMLTAINPRVKRFYLTSADAQTARSAIKDTTASTK
ncbi:MAG: alanine racemase [Proteobacteria bacterium]|nr:alanine racemase [Pseudomonadota bacterium]